MTWADKLSQWPGWRLLGALACVIVVGVVFYIGITVHEHNNQLNHVATEIMQAKAQVHCMKVAFNQVLTEAFHHHQIQRPPSC